MDAVEFLKGFKRMCEAYDKDGFCKNCPAYEYNCCTNFNGQENDAVQIVEQWAKEHPVKTRQSEFLKMFPNARIDDGVIFLGPCAIDRVEYDSYKCTMNCKKCCRDYWLKEIE